MTTVRSAGTAPHPAVRPSVEPATPILFSDRGCPFAHRVLALFEHLGSPVELHESVVGETHEGLDRYTASLRIPLLVHGELVLTESRVILEYIAEYHGLPGAYPADVGARALHRHAMAVVDHAVVPALFDRKRVEATDTRLEDALRALSAAIATESEGSFLLALYMAPIWLRFRWWQPAGMVTRAIEARPALCRWLDATLELDCVANTAPDRAVDANDRVRALQAGLLGPSTI